MASGTASRGLAAGGVCAAPDRLAHKPIAANVAGSLLKRIAVLPRIEDTIILDYFSPAGVSRGASPINPDCSACDRQVACAEVQRAALPIARCPSAASSWVPGDTKFSH